jgi:nucleotide-binding universal stress UspA family protein
MWDECIFPLLTRACDRDTTLEASVSSAPLISDQPSIRFPCKKILLTYDGSPSAEKALQVALAIALEFNAKLLVMGVAPLPPVPDATDLQRTAERAQELFSKKLYKFRLDGMNEGLQVETLLALGDPGELSRYNAKRFHTHLIVVGCQDYAIVPKRNPTAVSESTSGASPVSLLVPGQAANNPAARPAIDKEIE